MSGALKLGPIPDDKPVRLTIELSAATHRRLVDYAAAHERQTNQKLEPAKLIGPMLDRFMATDRAFVRGRASRERDAD
jgi:hypothetical protein